MSHVQKREQDREQKSALVHARGLQSADRENLSRIEEIRSPIEGEHEGFSRRHSDEGAIDGEICDGLGFQPGFGCQLPGDKMATRNAIATRTPYVGI